MIRPVFGAVCHLLLDENFFFFLQEIELRTLCILVKFSTIELCLLMMISSLLNLFSFCPLTYKHYLSSACVGAHCWQSGGFAGQYSIFCSGKKINSLRLKCSTILLPSGTLRERMWIFSVEKRDGDLGGLVVEWRSQVEANFLGNMLSYLWNKSPGEQLVVLSMAIAKVRFPSNMKTVLNMQARLPIDLFRLGTARCSWL